MRSSKTESTNPASRQSISYVRTASWLELGIPPTRQNVIWAGNIDQKAVSKPDLAYPRQPRSTNFHGDFVVSVLVDKNGTVVSAEGLSGPPPLRQAAAVAACQATFHPAWIDRPTVLFS